MQQTKIGLTKDSVCRGF